MPVWELYYHLIISTTERWPFIDAEMEPLLHKFLYEKASELEAKVYGINGVRDHVHLVVSIPPNISVATFIEQIKAYSSANIHECSPRFKAFSWQFDYGVFSFGKRNLQMVLNYVINQKEHHLDGTIIRLLETWDESDWQIRESHEEYGTEGDDLLA